MKKRDRKNAGFTMVELVVVMVIVGILATISVPMYRNYIQRARAQEGVALVGSVASAQRVYYAEFGSFYAVGNTGYDATLGVDAQANSYFTTYSVTVAGDSFTVTSDGTGDAAGLTVTATGGAGAPTNIDVIGL